MRLFAFADEASPMIDQQIAAMQRNGLNGLEIRGVDGTNVSEISLEKAKEVRGKLDDAGLITWSIGSPIGKIDIEKDDFAAHVEKFKHTLQIADVLGAQNVRMFSFFIPQGKNPADYQGEVIDRLNTLAELADGTGIDLCHENEKGIYGDLAPRCLQIHQQVPALKAVFDPANFVQCGQDTLQAWTLLKPYVKYMHIKDAMPDGRVVPAGRGSGNLPAILGEFAGFGRELTIEPHLAVFKGLQDLEREGETSNVGQYVYPSNDAAFDAACAALKEILK